MLDNFKVDFLKKGSVKTFNSSDKFSRINNSNMDIWWFLGRIFFLMSYFVGDCETLIIIKTLDEEYWITDGQNMSPTCILTKPQTEYNQGSQ